MIPAIPQIEDSLAGLKLTDVRQPVPGEQFLIVCEPTTRFVLGETPVQDDTCIVLTQPSGAPMTLPRLVDRVAEALHKAGHAHVGPKAQQRPLLATKVLGLAAAYQSASSRLLDTLNTMIKAISAVQITQWAVLAGRAPGSEQYRFGDFAYGVIELNKLRFRCEKAGSDYFDRYSEALRGRLSVVRETSHLRTMDVNSIPLEYELDPVNTKLAYRITDDYYGNIAEAEQRRFMVDLDRQQAIFGAAGLGRIRSETLRRMSSWTHWITVFCRQQRLHGWVLPNQTVFHIRSTVPGALSAGHTRINSALALQDWDKRALDPFIQTFCEYFTASQDHEADERVEEALLHLVFGLDLLLGGKTGDALTQVLAERVAILSHRSLSQPIDKICAFVKECYDMRSGYVHRGEKGKSTGLSDRLEKLMQLARAVLGAACFARLQAWCEGDDPRSAWINRVDVLRAKHTAGVPFEDAEVMGLGLDFLRLNPAGVTRVSIDLEG